MSHDVIADAYESIRVYTLGAARGPVAAALRRSGGAPRPGPRSTLRALRAHGALRSRRYDVVHLADARLAPLGRWLRRRTGLPVSVDVGPQDLAALRSHARLAAALDALDTAFVFSDGGEQALRSLARRVPVAVLPLIADAEPEPVPAAATRVQRALRDADPLRPVVVLPWTRDLAAWRSSAPLFRALGDAGVTWVAAGMPGAGDARMLRAALELPLLRGLPAPLDDATVAALGRCADAFVLPWRLAPEAPAADALVRLALAASGVPVVASDHAENVLVHERNGFLVRDGDIAGFRSTLARLLGVPARQRHYMGAEFAAYTVARWPLGAAIDTYEERLAAIAGRAPVPLELRAAA